VKPGGHAFTGQCLQRIACEAVCYVNPDSCVYFSALRMLHEMCAIQLFLQLCTKDNVMLLLDFSTGSIQGNKEGRSEQFNPKISGVVGRICHGDVKQRTQQLCHISQTCRSSSGCHDDDAISSISCCINW